MTIPPSSRVPGRNSDLSRSGGDDGGGLGPVEEKMINREAFLGQEGLYGRKT